MASFISTLSLFLLVLSNGCFTLPVVDETLLTATFSSLDETVTTGPVFNLRLVSEDETNAFPTTDKIYSVDEQTELETSTSWNNLSEENLARLSRVFEEFSTASTTIEQSGTEKREYDDYLYTTEESTTTTEQIDSKKREYDDFLYTTEESTTTTEQTDSEKRQYDDLSFTTVPAIIQGIELQRRGIDNETDSDTENDKRETPVELTTNEMFTFTSTSTQKYTGLLTDKTENEKSHVLSEEHLEENSKDNAAPTAIYDQEALNKIHNVPVEYLALDENNTLVVTDFPKKFSTTTMKIPHEQKPLDQGEESLHTKEKESNN